MSKFPPGTVGRVTVDQPGFDNLIALTRPAVIINGKRCGCGAFALGGMAAPGDQRLPGFVVPHLDRPPDFIYLANIRSVDVMLSRRGRYVIVIQTTTADPFAVPKGSHGLRNAVLN